MLNATTIAELIELETVGRNKRDPVFLPTEEDIRAACDQIQAGWSRGERRRRALGIVPSPNGWRGTLAPSAGAWTVPVVRSGKAVGA